MNISLKYLLMIILFLIVTTGCSSRIGESMIYKELRTQNAHQNAPLKTPEPISNLSYQKIKRILDIE